MTFYLTFEVLLFEMASSRARFYLAWWTFLPTRRVLSFSLGEVMYHLESSEVQDAARDSTESLELLILWCEVFCSYFSEEKFQVILKNRFQQSLRFAMLSFWIVLRQFFYLVHMGIFPSFLQFPCFTDSLTHTR